jgi:GGDEF domain-containing protein
VVEFAAQQIGPALERALVFEQERQASLFDGETGLPNDRYLQRVLASAAFCNRGDGPKPGILMLAVDSGPHSESAVRDVLLRLAATARMAVRVTDLVFRTGTHEITILMSDSTSEAMSTVARRVTESMGDLSTFGATPRVVPSFALYPDHAEEPADLPRAARARLGALALVTRKSA